MKNLHFRSPREPKAGNFVPSISLNDLIQMFRPQLVSDITQAIADDDSLISATYSSNKLLGWSSCVPSQFINTATMEKFHLNKRATAWRFQPSYTGQAPLTAEVTFIVSISSDGRVGIIQSVYPGPDVGTLEGYVSAREQIVFFSFDHPGEALH